MSVVRRAVVGDADAIGSVHVRAWQAAYRGQMSDGFLDGMSIADGRRRWRTTLSEPTPDRVVVVVEDPVDGHVCGFAALGAAEVMAINLEPEAWGRGLGSALLAGALDALREHEVPEVHLWVLEANARARRFYERAGWSADGGVKDGDFGGRTLREVRYRRGLTGPPARD